MNLTTEQIEELRRIMSEKRTIEAIKQARAWTGLGLREAKDLVENLAPGKNAPFDYQTLRPSDLSGIDELVRAGKKIEAIKVYRQASGCDLRTAKKFVENRALQIDAPKNGPLGDPMVVTQGKGCLVLLITCALAGVYFLIKA